MTILQVNSRSIEKAAKYAPAMQICSRFPFRPTGCAWPDRQSITIRMMRADGSMGHPNAGKAHEPKGGLNAEEMIAMVAVFLGGCSSLHDGTGMTERAGNTILIEVPVRTRQISSGTSTKGEMS